MAVAKLSSILRRLGIGSAATEAFSVVTRETSHGNLRMDVVFDCPGLDEPALLEIIVRKPARVFAVCDSLKGWTPEGGKVWRPPGDPEMDRARRVSTPLLIDPSSGKLTTTAYLADFGDGYRNRVPFGDVTFHVLGASSRKRLLSARRRINAT